MSYTNASYVICHRSSHASHDFAALPHGLYTPHRYGSQAEGAVTGGGGGKGLSSRRTSFCPSLRITSAARFVGPSLRPSRAPANCGPALSSAGSERGAGKRPVGVAVASIKQYRQVSKSGFDTCWHFSLHRCAPFANAPFALLRSVQPSNRKTSFSKRGVGTYIK